MLKPAYPAQTELEMVTLEQLVPKDHLLRLLDQHIRFDFIREATQHLYCENNGRPAIDPVVLFKMLFILQTAVADDSRGGKSGRLGVSWEIEESPDG